MAKPLKNHPGMWLADNAADALNALEDKYGVIRINRAGVTVAEQQEIIDRWDAGDRVGLFEPKRPAEKSEHVPGNAVDVYNYNDDKAKLHEFGFYQTHDWDVVHYVFFPDRVNKPLPSGSTIGETMIVRIPGKENVRHPGLWCLTATAKGKKVAVYLGPGEGSTGFPVIRGDAELKKLADIFHDLKV